MPKVVLVGGMHRSGTSLGASILKNSGLDLGKKFLKADKANKKGYFENAAFVELHRKVLVSEGFDEDGYKIKTPLSIPEKFEGELDKILAESKFEKDWGWKDPRNTIFLNYYAKKIPQSRFILFFRAPWEVLDSLYRRGDKLFIQNSSLAVQSWTVFNKLCLEFYTKNMDKTIIIHLPQVIENHPEFVNHVNEKFELNLIVPNKNNFDDSLLQTDVSKSHKPALIKNFFPDCYDTWIRLNEVGTKFKPEKFEYEEELDPDSLITDWMETRKAQREREVQNKLLFEKGDALWAAEEELRIIKGSRIWKLSNQISQSVKKIATRKEVDQTSQTRFTQI